MEIMGHESTHQVIDCGNGRFARCWADASALEGSAAEQIRRMATMPQLYRHLAIMPDCHYGKGATVGSVMALEGAVVPNCVGVDIGCGMAAINTGLSFEGEMATREFWQGWLARTAEAVPVGFSCHDRDRRGNQGGPEREARAVEHFGSEDWHQQPRAAGGLETGRKFRSLHEQMIRQAGTLGGGNHFLEAQRDEHGNVWIMVHSGSRNIGLRLAGHYDRRARELNAQWKSEAPQSLNWLPTDSEDGRDYLADMQWAVQYALFNRKEMLRSALGALELEFEEERMLNLPHNFAAMENHFGRNVLVHRKGATAARAGQPGIIPGSMGTASYIVEGLGNPDSFHSCSHGAGRAMSRTQAKREFSAEDMATSLSGTFTQADSGCIDETPQAYKDIDEVMARQQDLVKVVHRLSPVITLKSSDNAVD
ncbi:RtcB family protein [bacterium]|nr:RtcB family protein [bacterium]